MRFRVMRFRVMRFRVMRFRVMRFRAPSAAPASGVMAGGDVPAVTAVPPLPPLGASGEWGIGHPSVESQRAGVDYLILIAMEQAAARRCPPTGSAETDRADDTGRAGPGAGLPGADGDGTPEAYRHI
jgi:hypothetical protein